MTSSPDEKKTQGNQPIGLRNNGLPYTVFIIDDSNTAREVLKRILLSMQFKIVGEASNGEIAVMMLKSSSLKPDFISVDMEMPQMDGIETIKQIRPIVPESRMIMVTSHAERDMVEELMKLNVSGFIKKPYDRDTVVKKISLMTGRATNE
jgi:two-component system, chemotaxis family, chemotaxis protein CheY